MNIYIFFLFKEYILISIFYCLCFSYELAISLQPYTAHHTHNTSSHNTKHIYTVPIHIHDKIFEGDILHFSHPPAG